LSHDHGIGKGGTLVDFEIIYHGCTVKELLSKVGEFNFKNFSFQLPQASERKKLCDDTGKIMIIGSRIISDPGLIKYLDERKIPLVIVKKYCTEVDFERFGKKHRAIGFKNNAGSFELRNNYFKGSSSPKDIPLIKNNNKELSVLIEKFGWKQLSDMHKIGGRKMKNLYEEDGFHRFFFNTSIFFG
jgi:hypothetical protein